MIRVIFDLLQGESSFLVKLWIAGYGLRDKRDANGYPLLDKYHHYMAMSEEIVYIHYTKNCSKKM